MKTVTIALDVSRSMMEYFREACEKAITVIKQLGNGELVGVATFSDTLQEIHYSTAIEAQSTCEALRDRAASVDFKWGDSTKLFDCAAEAAEKLAQYAQNQDAGARVLVVITDDMNDGSQKFHSWRDLDWLLHTHGVKMRVIQVGEGAGLTDAGQQPVPTGMGVVNQPSNPLGENIEITFDVSQLFKPVKRNRVTYAHISCPVICLDASVEPETIAAIAAKYRAVIPYLEGLTGLRYYPVPTVIVDESTYRELADPAPNLYYETLEMLNAICLLHHIGKAIWLDEQGNRVDYDHLQDGSFLFWTRTRAEGFACPVDTFCKTGRWEEGAQFDKEESPHATTNCMIRALNLITAGWKEAAREQPENCIESHGGFGAYKQFGFHCRQFSHDVVDDIANFLGIRENIHPEVWRTTRYCEGGCGLLPSYCFETTAQEYAAMLEGLANWVKRLLQMRSLMDVSPLTPNVYAAEALATFIQIVRRYGFYARKSGLRSSLPTPVGNLNENSGVVILCAKPIQEAAKSMHQSIGNMTADIFGSILAHEHFHAILEEGRPVRGPSSANAIAMEESLAEWAQIDFDRDNPIMKSWCIEHAMSGVFPLWPYAGALFVEKLVGRESDPGKAAQKMILEFRNDPDGTITKFLQDACPVFNVLPKESNLMQESLQSHKKTTKY